MNLLHLDSGILGENSVSRKLSKAVVERVEGNERVLHDLIDRGQYRRHLRRLTRRIEDPLSGPARPCVGSA